MKPGQGIIMKLRIILILVFVGVGAVLVTYLLRPKPISVLVQAVERGRIEATVANTRAGTVKACRRALLAPATGGQIFELPVREGMRVKTGDLLLSLWNEDLRAEVQLARSEIEAAQAKAKATCLEAEIAARQAGRYTALEKSQAIAEEQLDQAVTTARAREADCMAAQATVKVSAAREAAARAQLERTILKAPFGGVIAEVNGELGEYVTPSPPGIPTLPAVDLADTSCFYITAPIDEVDAAAIRSGMAARISLDAFAGRSFPGKVRRIADYVLDREKQARTVDIEVIFTESQDMTALLPGYSADAEIIVDVKEGAVRVPSEAVIENERLYVYLPGEGVLRERHVVVGLSNWDYTEIVEGVKEGEQVVLSVDRKGIKDGAKAVAEKGE
jgi:HlyD family secretion protein